ncbi:MAG: hypothetical protein Fur0032_11060 [Terrimicrobiaceae bacterium]
MKTLLLVVALCLTVNLLPAEEVVVSQSAFGGGQGVNGSVAAVAIQPDGKIVIGGTFNAVNGVPRSNIARLNADGTLDRSFADTIIAGVSGPVYAVAIRPDGSIVVGGSFSQAGGVEVSNFALYLPDATVDPKFARQGQIGANAPVYALAVQPDGKIVLGGAFSQVCGEQRLGIARLNTDGTVDTAIPPKGELTGQVRALGVAAEGGIIAGGNFQVTNQIAHSLFQAPAESPAP